jgi:hypothetical protein
MYKTFAWTSIDGTMDSGHVSNEIVDNNIRNAISTELERNGWKESNQDPDVLLDYNVMVDKIDKVETEPVYSYPNTFYYYNRRLKRIGYIYTPSHLRGYNTYNVPFNQGTLTVNMIDAKTNKLIWQGWSQREINNSNITTRDAQNNVKSIFKKFSLPKTNA